jgi:regulator of replication initiation timing
MSDTFDHECEAYDSFEREMRELSDKVKRLTTENAKLKIENTQLKWQVEHLSEDHAKQWNRAEELRERLKGIEKVYKKYEGMVPAKESLIYSTFAVVTLMDLWQAIKKACEVKE